MCVCMCVCLLVLSACTRIDVPRKGEGERRAGEGWRENRRGGREGEGSERVEEEGGETEREGAILHHRTCSQLTCAGRKTIPFTRPECASAWHAYFLSAAWPTNTPSLLKPLKTATQSTRRVLRNADTSPVYENKQLNNACLRNKNTRQHTLFSTTNTEARRVCINHPIIFQDFCSNCGRHESTLL